MCFISINLVHGNYVQCTSSPCLAPPCVTIEHLAGTFMCTYKCDELNLLYVALPNANTELSIEKVRYTVKYM